MAKQFHNRVSQLCIVQLLWTAYSNRVGNKMIGVSYHDRFKVFLRARMVFFTLAFYTSILHFHFIYRNIDFIFCDSKPYFFFSLFVQKGISLFFILKRLSASFYPGYLHKILTLYQLVNFNSMLFRCFHYLRAIQV